MVRADSEKMRSGGDVAQNSTSMKISQHVYFTSVSLAHIFDKIQKGRLRWRDIRILLSTLMLLHLMILLIAFSTPSFPPPLVQDPFPPPLTNVLFDGCHQPKISQILSKSLLSVID